jgi:hypothetical protein
LAVISAAALFLNLPQLVSGLRPCESLKKVCPSHILRHTLEPVGFDGDAADFDILEEWLLVGYFTPYEGT